MDASQLIELLLRNAFEALLHQPFCALVAIVHGIVQQITAFVEQAEIHAPGINGNGVKATVLLCFEQTLLDFIILAQHIPIEGAADGHRVV